MGAEIALEQSLASAVRYVQNRANSDSFMYFDDLPEKFIIPALYFPVPRSTTRKVTFDTYLTTIYMEVWFLASKDWAAQEDAGNVRDCIILDDCKMDYMESDGTLTGKGFHVTEPETKVIDTGVVSLSFGIQHYLSKEKEPGQKINQVFYNGLIKPDKLYMAWWKATQELKEIQEVEKACLIEALKTL